jgi:hypothetical protein
VSRKITSPQGPKGEELTKVGKSGVKESLDTRYQGWHTEDDAHAGGRTAADGYGINIAVAGYSVATSGVRRGYLRPTEFVSLDVKSDDAAHATKNQIEWLDDIEIAVKLVFRTVDGTDVAAEKQQVDFVITGPGGRRITDSADTDDDGLAQIMLSDPDIVPGPVGSKWTVTATHVPTRDGKTGQDPTGIWKAPDITAKFQVEPVGLGVVLNHPNIGSSNKVYFGAASATMAKVQVAGTHKWFRTTAMPLYINGESWLRLELDSEPTSKFDAIDAAGLLPQVKIKLYSEASFLNTARRASPPIKNPANNQLRAAHQWFLAHYGKGAPRIQLLGTGVFTAAGVKGIKGISATAEEDSRTIAITIDPKAIPGVTLSNVVRWLRYQYMYIALYATVVDDAAATRRWTGGAWTQTHNVQQGGVGPYEAGWTQPTYRPILFKFVTTAVSAVSGGGGATTAKHRHTVPGQSAAAMSAYAVKTSRGARRDGNVYWGRYSGTWGTMSSRITFGHAATLRPSNVVGGNIRFHVAHTYSNAGGTIRLNFGGGGSTPTRNVHVPKSGWVTVKMSAAEAKALARTRVLGISPVGGSPGNYGYASARSFKVVFQQRG